MPAFMIYYIHGYLSEPNSTKGTLFKEKLGVKPIKYRDCPPEELIISDCINNIKKEIGNDENVVLIGSSLGGFLAAETALIHPVKKLILLNPAIIPISIDIKKIQGMPQEILKDMQDPKLFEKMNSEIYVLIGTEDDVVPNNWPIEFAKAQEATIHFLKEDHSFSKDLNKLTDVIKQLIS